MSAARIYHLRIDRFRGIKDLSWHAARAASTSVRSVLDLRDLRLACARLLSQFLRKLSSTT
jgi:hypothetical protein